MADSTREPESSDPGDRGLFGDISKPDDKPIDIDYSKPTKHDRKSKRAHPKRHKRAIDPDQGATPATTTGAGAGAGNGRSGSSGKRPTATRTPTQKRETLKSLLWTLNTSIAIVVKCPELAIEQEEAEKLAAAYDRLFEAYGVAEISEKGAAIMEVIGVTGAVYMPRMIAITLRKKRKPQLVTPFPQPTTATATGTATAGFPATAPQAQQQQQSPSKANGAVKKESLPDALAMPATETIVQ